MQVFTHLSEPTACTAPRVNPGVNYWVTMMYHCRATDCSKGTTLVWDAVSGSGYVVGGGGEGKQEIYRISLYISLNFAVNLKLFQVKSSLKKKLGWTKT